MGDGRAIAEQLELDHHRLAQLKATGAVGGDGLEEAICPEAACSAAAPVSPWSTHTTSTWSPVNSCTWATSAATWVRSSALAGVTLSAYKLPRVSTA
jgi:hypothetical protein